MATDPKVEIRELLTDLFGSQMAAARRLHYHDRTVRWWCQFGPPPHVLKTLRRLANGEIQLRHARTTMHRRRERRPNGQGSTALTPPA